MVGHRRLSFHLVSLLRPTIISLCMFNVHYADLHRLYNSTYFYTFFEVSVLIYLLFKCRNGAMEAQYD